MGGGCSHAAVAAGLGTPSPVAGSVPVLPDARAGLLVSPWPGLGTPLHGCQRWLGCALGCWAGCCAPQAVFLLFPHEVIGVFSVFISPKSQGVSLSRGACTQHAGSTRGHQCVPWGDRGTSQHRCHGAPAASPAVSQPGRGHCGAVGQRGHPRVHGQVKHSQHPVHSQRG